MYYDKNLGKGHRTPVDNTVIHQLERVQKRIQAAIDAIQDDTQPEHTTEFNIRQSLHVLKDVRRTLLHG